MKETQLLVQDDVIFNNFHYFRQKYQLTRKSMALLLDIPPFFVRLMDERRYVASTIELSTVVRMAQIFGIDVTDFICVDFSAGQQPSDR